MEAAGIVMRTLASCPRRFEWASTTSAGWAVLPLIKQRGGGGVREGQGDSEETGLSRNKWKISVLATGEGSEPNYCFILSLLRSVFCFFPPFFLLLFLDEKTRLSRCCFVSRRLSPQCFSSRSTRRLRLALSGMLEQHWGSYICRHA